MAMASARADEVAAYRFGAFELNLRSRQLLRLGRVVAIQPRPFDLLLYLVRHRDRVVPRDEILAEVWQGVHVDDEALRFTLHAARRAVGDDGTRQEVIRTVFRVGYRLVAPVVELAGARDAAPREGRKSPAHAETPFLGRDALMDEVATLLGEVNGGGGRVLLLSGEAGIGKSRALEEIETLAQEQGIGVLRGRCVESEGAPAFWPWIQILREAVGSRPSGALLEALGTGAREVAWMVPELRPYVRDLPPTPIDDARAARFLMFDSVTAFLRALTAEQAFVVSIDDLHRADAASAALLHHVARELADAAAPRLLLVGTHREAELRAAAPLADTVAAIAAFAHAHHRQIQGLASDDVAALVRALSGRDPNASAVADLHAKTNGNPFFLNQILRVLRSESRLAELDSARSVELELPRHVQDAIRRQLQVFSEDTQEALEIASVVGGDFTLAELEGAMELERDVLLGRLAAPIEADVVREDAVHPGRYRFTHVLMRDALYAGLPIDVRARIHACVARSIEASVPMHPSVASVSVAHHYAKSSERGGIERAVHYYEQAARWSTSRGAFEDAPQHLDHALALLEGARSATQKRRCQLLLALGDALGDAGARERAREVLLDAAKLARHASLHEELASAALHFAPDLLAIETGVYDRDLVWLLEEAIAGLGEEDDSLRAKLLARLAFALQWSDKDHARGRSLCEQAGELVSKTDDRDAKDYVRTASAFVYYSLRDPGGALVEPSSAGSERLEILQRLLRVTSLMLMGRIVQVDTEISQFADLVIRSRHPRAQWYVDLLRSTRAQMEGRFDEAERLANRYLAVGSRFNDRNVIQSFVTQMIMAGFDTGHLIDEERVRAMVEAFPSMGGWRSGLTLYLAETGRLDEARVEFHVAVDSGALERSRPIEWYGTYAALALACGELGERKVAKILYSRLYPQRDQLVVVGYSSYCAGSCHRLLAVLASVLGRAEIAEDHFEAAIVMNAASGAPACNGRVHFEYSRALKVAGERERSIEHAIDAKAIASRFGMNRLVARIDRYLALE